MAEQDDTKYDTFVFQDIKIEEEEMKLEKFEDEITEKEMYFEEDKLCSFYEEKLQRVKENDGFKTTQMEAERCVSLGSDENYLLVDFKVNQTGFKKCHAEESEIIQVSCSRKNGTSNRRRSLNIKPKSFQCNTCECCFDYKYQLENHAATFHGKDKPFMCAECGYSCSRIGDLTLHIRSVHIKEKLFKCTKYDFSCSANRNFVTNINYAENIIFSSRASSTNFTEKLFTNLAAYPWSSTTIRPQSEVINEQYSLGIEFSEGSMATGGFDISENISDHKLQKEFLLRYDLIHNRNQDINYSQASSSRDSQFSLASFPPPFSDLVSENDQSNWSATDLYKSDYNDDIFSVNSLPRSHESTPSPSPSRVSGRKRVSLEHLNDEEKYQRIRDQNNLASREYRQRRKNIKTQVSDELTELIKQNVYLKQCVKNLQNAVDNCKELIKTLSIA